MRNHTLLPNSNLGLRRQGRRLVWLLLLVAVLLGAAPYNSSAGNAFIEFYNEDLFFEKVNALGQIKIGASTAEVIGMVGEPVEKTALGDGSKVFVYRLRLYKGREPLSNLSRQLYLTSETKIVFDNHDRVTSMYREP